MYGFNIIFSDGIRTTSHPKEQCHVGASLN